MAENATTNKPEITIEVVEGISKKTKNPYKCLEVRVGEYTQRIFPTKIELLYIENILGS